MKFTVLWRLTAERDLANIWNVGPDRGAIAKAADQIDETLKLRPKEGPGIVRSGEDYYLKVYPLGVDYEVNEDDRKVIVNAIWRITDMPQN